VSFLSLRLLLSCWFYISFHYSNVVFLSKNEKGISSVVSYRGIIVRFQKEKGRRKWITDSMMNIKRGMLIRARALFPTNTL
jgi:hypothetical protein